MFHHGIHCQTSSSGNRFVAGVGLVRAVVLTAEQIGVDRDWSVIKIQIKEFIRQSEKVSTFRRRPGWEQAAGHESPRY